VEHTPNTVYTWGLFKQNVGLNQIVKVGEMMCWAAKWAGSKKVIFNSTQSSSKEDMVAQLYALMDEADIVVTYNGNSYDNKVIAREFLMAGFTPPSPIKSVDLYRTVRSKVRFTSNKLDFVCQQLGIGAKTSHAGMQLWVDCMDGDEKAWKVMERYNKQDVKILEKLYYKLRSWHDGHPHMALYREDDKEVCRNCGSDKVQRRGYAYTNLGKYRRIACMACGSWMRGKRNLMMVEGR